VAAVCGCVAVGSPLQMLSVRMYHNLFSPGFVLCVSLVCAVLCCAVLCRPINDSTEPVEAQGPYEVIDADNISEYGAHRGSARVAAAGGCWSSSV
jgi:hypothetical protein